MKRFQNIIERIVRRAGALAFFYCAVLPPVVHAWQSDLGNGQYKNPVLFADYSDPDVIRVGSEFYMVSSSFHFMPGIPVLESKDLVNWRIIGHVYDRFDFDPAYDLTNGDRYGKGCWAPAICFHEGRFWVYFPTPQEGIFMSSAKSAAGPWSTPVQVKKIAGWEDPCPFWDDDGKAYLIHSVLGAGTVSYTHLDVYKRQVGAVAIRLKDPVFESQTKNKLGNTEIRTELVNNVREELLHFFQRNKQIAETIIAKVADTQQLRKELQQVKKLARERAKAITLRIPQLKD